MVSHTRVYKENTYTIKSTPEGWECSNGYVYSSLSAASQDITGRAKSGPEFWVERPRRTAAAPQAANGRKPAMRADKSRSKEDAKLLQTIKSFNDDELLEAFKRLAAAAAKGAKSA